MIWQLLFPPPLSVHDVLLKLPVPLLENVTVPSTVCFELGGPVSSTVAVHVVFVPRFMVVCEQDSIVDVGRLT